MSVIRRLPRYYRFLEELMQRGVDRISSKEFAGIIGVTASQVRQDLNCFGGFGQQGYGYNVTALHHEIGRILSVDKLLPTVLIGAGNLGSAITRQMDFESRGFQLVGVFDNNPAIIGKKIRDWVITDVAELKGFCEEHKPRAAILCIPKAVAKDICALLVELGVRGFWNFSHYDIAIPYGDRVWVENVHLGDSLMTLSYLINED
jgi:redox-sensing transcriptional repressor